MSRQFSLLCCLLCLQFTLFAQNRQPVYQLSHYSQGTYAFTHCTLVPKAGEIIENATLIIKDGRIVQVGKNLKLPAEALSIDLEHAWVYPGFIDPYSNCGMKAAKAEGGGRGNPPQYERKGDGPYYWNQAVRPEYELVSEYQVDEKAIEQLRVEGFTTLNIPPNDGIFRGTGILLQASSGSLQDKLLSPQSCAAYSFQKGSSAQAYPSSLMGSIALLRQAFLDIKWYQQASQAHQQNPKLDFQANLSLQAANEQLQQNLPHIFESPSYLHTLRAAKVAQEAGIQWIYKTKGDEYNRLEEIKALNASFIVSLNFPKAFEVEDPSDAHTINLKQLRQWQQAPSNPSLLAERNIPFAFTLSDLKQTKAFRPNLHQAIERGLSKEAALHALTLAAARMLNIDQQVGSLEKGKLANFVVASDDLFSEKKAKILDVYVGGERHVVQARSSVRVAGEYQLDLDGETFLVEVEEKEVGKYKASVQTDGKELKGAKVSVNGQQMSVVFPDERADYWRIEGLVDGGTWKGRAESPKGESIPFSIKKVEVISEVMPEELVDEPIPPMLKITYPNRAYGFQQLPTVETVLIQHATIWTNTEAGILENWDVLLEDGKIAKVDSAIKAPKEARIIDGTNYHLTAGIIDEHSHIAISQGVNEGTHAVSAEVRIGDVINPEDINIYRQLAGGVTASQLLHGSANPIGGQSAIIKLRWGRTAEEMKFKEAKPFIKFALGENVKQSNWGDDYKLRYPQTRMGVEQMMKDAFQTAKDYRAGLNQPKGLPKKRDLQVEALLEILDGERHISCHSYVQSEITMLMRLAEAEGFRINTFTHVLEGYKIADKLREHGATASTFSDWWGYKFEVNEAIPYNAAILYEQGVNTCINSDDAEMGRRLNQEAAKAVKYGKVPEEEALKMVTLNPAIALGVEEYVGSVEEGKQADLVLWSDHPLSVYAQTRYTFIDGIAYFDFERDAELREAVQIERNQLIQAMLREKGEKRDPSKGRHEHKLWHCDDLGGL